MIYLIIVWIIAVHYSVALVLNVRQDITNDGLASQTAAYFVPAPLDGNLYLLEDGLVATSLRLGRWSLTVGGRTMVSILEPFGPE